MSLRRKKRSLSPVEWELMDAVWHLDRAVNVRDVLETAYPKHNKAYTTVQTIMNILAGKGILMRMKKGRSNQYFPRFTRDDIRTGALDALAERMFHSSLGSMAQYLVRSGSLNEAEIAELRDLLTRHQTVY